MRRKLVITFMILALLLAGAVGGSAAAPAEVQQALAPTGKLRIALQIGNPLNAVRDPASGELKGLGLYLGIVLAQRLGVPFELIQYPSIGALLDAGKTGAWDVAFVGFSSERAKDWEFAPLHVEVEFGYLVPGGSRISTIADVDRPGVRVAVQERSGPEAFFSSALKNATLVRGPSNPGALELVRSGRADVMGSIKPILFELSTQLPGSRVLDGAPGTDPHAMAMPKGRGVRAVAYARQFIEDAKARGWIKAAIATAGLRGVNVAP